MDAPALTYETAVFRFDGDCGILPPSIFSAQYRWVNAAEDRAGFERAVRLVLTETLDRRDRHTIASGGLEAAVRAYLDPSPKRVVVDPSEWETAWLGDEIVGLIQPMLSIDGGREGRPLGTIGFIGVAPAFRGKGTIRDLIGYATAMLRNENVWQIYCEVDTENAPMIRALEKKGFARGEVRTISIERRYTT